jgi:hypothetical protein
MEETTGQQGIAGHRRVAAGHHRASQGFTGQVQDTSQKVLGTSTKATSWEVILELVMEETAGHRRVVAG